MKRALFGFVLVIVGLAAGFVLPPEDPVRYIAYGLAATGVLVIIVTAIEGSGE